MPKWPKWLHPIIRRQGIGPSQHPILAPWKGAPWTDEKAGRRDFVSYFPMPSWTTNRQIEAVEFNYFFLRIMRIGLPEWEHCEHNMRNAQFICSTLISMFSWFSFSSSFLAFSFSMWHGWYRPRRSGCPRPCKDTRKKIRTFWPFLFSMRSQEIPKSNVQYFHCFSIIKPRTWWSSHLQQIISHEYLEVKAIWRSIMICPNPAVWIDSTCVWTHEIQGCLWVKRLWLMIHSLMTWSFPNTHTHIIYTIYILEKFLYPFQMMKSPLLLVKWWNISRDPLDAISWSI